MMFENTKSDVSRNESRIIAALAYDGLLYTESYSNDSYWNLFDTEKVNKGTQELVIISHLINPKEIAPVLSFTLHPISTATADNNDIVLLVDKK